MTERLTETYPCDLCNVEFCYRQCYKMTLWAEKAKEKLAEYETAEEEGRLVVLPCKVGDTVYVVAQKYKICNTRLDCDEYDNEDYLPSWCEDNCPYGYKGIGVIEDTVLHIEIRKNGICYCTTNCGYLYEDKVFLTREEAEKASKEKKNEICTV